MWLVVARFVAPHKKGYFYFLCDFPGRDWSQKQIVEFAIKGYYQRWKIEEVHRHLKQDFGWEEMKLMRYQSLKKLNTLFWLVVCFLYSPNRWFKPSSSWAQNDFGRMQASSRW